MVSLLHPIYALVCDDVCYIALFEVMPILVNEFGVVVQALPWYDCPVVEACRLMWLALT